MFVSFFPRPNLLFFSAALWALFLVCLWFFVGKELILLSFSENNSPSSGYFFYFFSLISPSYLLFYSFFLGGLFVFYVFWRLFFPHPYQNWSILGSGFIIFTTNFLIQITILFNAWQGSFYDLIQKALTKPESVSSLQLFQGVSQFLTLALLYVTVLVLNSFFVKHYVFRWRTAMSLYFTQEWQRLRHIEGASQRIQDDTMRFARTMESLGVNFVDSLMTLIAFLPLLAHLSVHVTALPIIGGGTYPLVMAACLWSVFGTALLALTGYRLPGLEFKNQRVEAALRKELVYGEDDEMRAHPLTLAELFSHVRKNYFTLYLHYMYFDVTRYLYLQMDNVFAIMILIPTIAAGKITFGIFHQIVSAFRQVSASFQYLVSSWPTIIELISIWKRLRAFEATLEGETVQEGYKI